MKEEINIKPTLGSEVLVIQGDQTKGPDYFQRGYYEVNPKENPDIMLEILKWIGILFGLGFLFGAIKFFALILIELLSFIWLQ